MPTIAESASGASYSSGTARSPLVLAAAALGSTGYSQSVGDASIAVALPLGGLADFGVWDATGVDPAVSCLLASTAGAPNGRAFVAAAAPTSYTTALGVLWNGAVNFAVRASWNGSAQTALTGLQPEAVNLGNLLPADAADYRGRLAYTGQLHDAVVTRSQERALTGVWAGKMVNAPGATVGTYAMWPLDVSVAPCTVGDLVHGSVWVALPRAGASWTAGLHFFDASLNPVGTWSMTAYATHPGGYAWQQSTVDATVPAGAAFVAVVPHVVAAAAGDGEVAYADCHRITSGLPAVSLAPRPFQPARQQNVTVRANRVNLVSNPSFAVDTYGYWSSGGTSPSFTQDPTVGRALPGAAKLVATYAAGTAWPQIGTRADSYGSQRGLARLTPGGLYTASGWVLLGPGCPRVVLSAQFDANTYIVGGDTNSALADPANLYNGWVRVFNTFTVPLSSSGNTSLIFGVDSSVWDGSIPTITYWLDDVMVEAGSVLGDFFDASVASPDYMWQGAAYQSPSHYYRDNRSLQYRLSDVVGGCVPLGVPYQLLYAQPES